MAENFPEEGLHLKQYLEIIRRRVWIIITFFVVTVTVVVFGTFRQTPIYKATTTVLIDRESPRVLSFKDVAPLGEERDYAQYYQTQLMIIKSRYIAEKAIEKLGLKNRYSPLENDTYIDEASSSGLFSSIKKWVVQLLEKEKEGSSAKPVEDSTKFLETLMAEPVRNSRLVAISVESYSPEEAAEVVNTVAEVYVEENLTRKIMASEGAITWINEELKRVKERVEESEKSLERYKKQTGILSLEKSHDIVVKKLTELNSAFTQVQLARIRTEEEYVKIEESAKKGIPLESISPIRDDELIQNLQSQYAKLKTEFNKLSETYKSEHPKMVQIRSQINQVEKDIDLETKKIIKNLKTKYERVKSEEKSLESILEKQKRDVQKLNDKAIQYNILSRESAASNKMYNILLEREKEIALSSTTKENNITILDVAKVPQNPIRPRKGMNLFLAVIVGLVLGTGLAFSVDYMDNTIRTAEDIKAAIKLPLLASIPNIRTKIITEKNKIVLKEKMSPASEAYRTLRTNLRFLSPDQPLKSILVTSSAPQEGKSITLCNLGITLAQTGNKVLLIDSDFRHLSLHKIFNLQKSLGLTAFLTKKAEIESIIQKTEIENLSIICGGKTPPNPSELLDSQKMKGFVEEAKSHFDIILYDSPPLVGISDAAILAGLVDGVIQIVRSGKTPRDLALLGKEILTNAGVKTIGIVLNDVNIHSGNYYYYYYHYHHYYNNTQKET